VKLLALVDSGADDCLFPLEVAQFLGLPLKRDAVHRYGGIGEGSIAATFGAVTLEVGKWTLWDFYVGFSESPSVVPILGQNGFFSKFEITFNRPEEIIKLKELSRRPHP
jgi:Aspartyl protease